MAIKHVITSILALQQLALISEEYMALGMIFFCHEKKFEKQNGVEL
jgi:hypothetical protein